MYVDHLSPADSIQTSANGIGPLVVGRATAGVGIGIASAMVPVYQAEIVGAP